MYESPIKTVVTDMKLMDIKEQLDSEIMRAVVNAEITVDREELIKALAYDRDQYNKGYEDGWKAAKEEELSNEGN